MRLTVCVCPLTSTRMTWPHWKVLPLRLAIRRVARQRGIHCLCLCGAYGVPACLHLRVGCRCGAACACLFLLMRSCLIARIRTLAFAGVPVSLEDDDDDDNDIGGGRHV